MTNEVTEFMQNNPVMYLATVDKAGNPKVRPFMYYLERDGKPYFCTSNKKPMYKEMQEHPKVEITVANQAFAWLRISATVSFSKDMEIQNASIDSSPIGKRLYKTAKNPAFEINTEVTGTATIADFSGQPPKTFSL